MDGVDVMREKRINGKRYEEKEEERKENNGFIIRNEGVERKKKDEDLNRVREYKEDLENRKEKEGKKEENK